MTCYILSEHLYLYVTMIHPIFGIFRFVTLKKNIYVKAIFRVENSHSSYINKFLFFHHRKSWYDSTTTGKSGQFSASAIFSDRFSRLHAPATGCTCSRWPGGVEPGEKNHGKTPGGFFKAEVIRMLIYGCDLEKNKKTSIFGQLEENERKVETFMDLQKKELWKVC